MSYFVGGKLKLKNKGKTNIATLQIKQQITKTAHSSLVKKQLKKENEILNDVKESLEIYNITDDNEKNMLDTIIKQEMNKSEIREKENDIKLKTNNNINYIDNRTDAEKKFDEMRLKRLPDTVKDEIKGKKKELKDKFTDILDKQLNHFDIPKVGSG